MVGAVLINTLSVVAIMAILGGIGYGIYRVVKWFSPKSTSSTDTNPLDDTTTIDTGNNATYSSVHFRIGRKKKQQKRRGSRRRG